jgi:hypothetical protein
MEQEPDGRQEWERRALEALVARRDLRWTRDPARPFPVRETWSDCPEGWWPIVERLVEQLVALGWDRRVAQVKDKLGGLRFYVGERDEAMVEAVARATEASESTCQACGAGGLAESWCVTHRPRGQP